MLTSFGIVNVSHLRGSERGLDTNENDSICVNVPLYHCFGCVSANLIMACHVSKLHRVLLNFDAYGVKLLK